MTCPSRLSSPEEENPRAETPNLLPADDRRSRMRFPLQLQARYRTLGGTQQVRGIGWAVNLSSGGALVVSEHEIPAGARVEVSIPWPSLLEGKIPLQLVTLGRVVRCAGVSFAVSFDRYQFRTLSSEVQSIRADNSDAMEWSIKKAAGI